MPAAAHPSLPTLPPAPRPASPLAKALAPTSELSTRERRLMVSAIAGAHLLGLWALLQVDAVRDSLREVAPLIVDLVAPPAPEPTPPPPPPPQQAPRPPTPLPQPPLLAAPTPQPVPAEAFSAPASPPEPAPLAAIASPPAPVASPAPPAPPPPVRRQVSATAVEYVVLPPFEVPRLSRRAREHGVVWLRVVVNTRGQPTQITLQRSSGYPRLDEQALGAMRQARFKPYTENGSAIEIEVSAPVEYPLE